MTGRTYNFAASDATRERLLLRAGLCGPTGSGKTFTALMLGARMVELLGLGPLFVIDSEHKSALRYAFSPRSGQGYRFKHVPMPEDDFSTEAYTAAVDFCESEGAGVILVDSLSHAWNGIGGVLEKVDTVTANSRSKNTFSEGWKTMTPAYNRFVERLMQSRAHLIFTTRAKVEWVVQENERGKKEPVKVGLAPVAREGLDYEPDLFFDMEQAKGDAVLWVTKSRAIDRPALRPGQRHVNPGAAWADEVIAWLEDGESADEARARQRDEALRVAIDAGVAAAEVRSADGYKDAKRGLLGACQRIGVSDADRDRALATFKDRVGAAVPKNGTVGAPIVGAILSDADRLAAIDQGRA